ncbi:MAG: hypothetical protein ACOYNI_12595 [Acidimicrobiia bacterium]
MADESNAPEPGFKPEAAAKRAAEQVVEFAEQLVIGESRWPAAVAIAGTIVLHLTMPERLTVGPNWLFPVLLSVALIPLLIATPRRSAESARWTRVLSLVLLGALAVTNFVSIGILIHEILVGRRSDITGQKLIWTAVNLWLTNVVVFGLSYWEIDAGGPEKRSDMDPPHPDFLFAQMTVPELFAPTSWRPVFIDYLYVSFTNSTAFSPTDTMPLTPRVKLLMGLQAGVSLITVALVAARAVNILG